MYAAVDLGTNGWLLTSLEPTISTVITQTYLGEVSEKHDVSEAIFLVDGLHSLQPACR